MLRTLSWFRSRFDPKPDPELERWIWACGQEISNRILASASTFNFGETLAEMGATSYQSAVADRAYRICLKRAWSDLSVSAGERSALGKVAALLGISPETQREFDIYTDSEIFGRLLARTLEDGVIDAKELARLKAVAQSAGRTVESMARDYLSCNGQTFLELIVGNARESGQITTDDWARTIRVVNSLGINESEFLELIRPEAERLVSGVISRIAADGAITDDEAASITSLVERLRLGADAVSRLNAATQRLTRVISMKNPDVNDVVHALTTKDQDAELAIEYSGDRHQSLFDLRRTRWWHVASETSSNNAKYHAGANTLVDTRPVWPANLPPRGIWKETPCCNISLSSGSVCFLPNGVLTVLNGGYRGYRKDQIDVTSSHFLTSQDLGGGARQVGNSWRYVNKSGGPDSRFRDNPTIPIYLVGNVGFPDTGIRLQLTDLGAIERFIGNQT